MNASLQAERRQFKGRKSRNLLAGQGKIPAVVYGKGIDSIPVAVDQRAAAKFLQKYGTSQLLDLKLDNDQYKVMIKDLQHHPLNQQLIHMDFLKVDLNEEIRITVPIRLVGEPKGIKEGGTMQHQLREVEVECLPTDVPEAVEVDVSHLEVGEAVYVRDLTAIEGVEIISEPDTLIASLVLAKAAPAAEGDEQDAGAEAAGEAAPEE